MASKAAETFGLGSMDYDGSDRIFGRFRGISASSVHRRLIRVDDSRASCFFDSQISLCLCSVKFDKADDFVRVTYIGPIVRANLRNLLLGFRIFLCLGLACPLGNWASSLRLSNCCRT